MEAALLQLVAAVRAGDNSGAIASASLSLCKSIDKFAAQGPRGLQAVQDIVTSYPVALSSLHRALVAARPQLHAALFERLRLAADWRPILPANRVFEAFVKGITYFADERDSNARPVYHRRSACGPATFEHRSGHLVCVEGLPAAELQRRRPLIERCYVERLIFDQIFRQEAAGEARDEGHVFNLERTMEDFRACFPKTKITVKVAYHLGMPHRVTIERSTPQSHGKTTLVYEKEYLHSAQAYSEVATCTRTMPDGTVWVSASTFETPGAFARVR
jgi:hypothetical protein